MIANLTVFLSLIITLIILFGILIPTMKDMIQERDDYGYIIWIAMIVIWITGIIIMIVRYLK